MTETQILQAVRDFAVESLDSVFEQLGALRTDTSEYAIAVDIDGEIRYAKIKVSASKAGYDAEASASEFVEVLAKREEKARADALKRAQKAEEKLAKAKARLEM